MLENDLKNPNNDIQSDEVLNQENAPKKSEEFALWKRAILLVIGFVGLEVTALIVTFLCIGIPASDRSAAVNLITYSILITGLLGFLNVDIKKFLPAFKKWKPYVFGLLFGVGVIVFDIVYINFVNLFYTAEVSGNETGVRNVIDLYPVATIFIFGLIGPLCEELTYRVGLFGLLRRVNRVLAYVVTGLVFGLLHFDWMAKDLINELIFLPTYIVPGVILSVAYDLFDLPCSWTAHAVNNLYAVIGHIIVSRM